MSLDRLSVGFGIATRFWLLNRSFWFLHRSFLFLKSVMLVAEANFLTILIPFIHFIRVIRWAYWLLGFSACPMASRLGFSASRLVRWLLGSASRLARRLLGFAASRLASLLLGFSASRLVRWFLGRISGPLLPVHCKLPLVIENEELVSMGDRLYFFKVALE